jgi:hypothetical protein
MRRQAPVTSDLKVLQAIDTLNQAAGQEQAYSSAEIAEAMGLTPFQVTARLKGMEGRELVARDEGYWYVTERGTDYRKDPPPERQSLPLGERVYKTPTGGLYSPGAAMVASMQDDEKVPRQAGCPGWKLKYQWGKKNPNYYNMSATQREVFIDTEGDEWV